MNYQNPQLLYALFAIAIPILIHLFNLRKYKPIYFSSIRFLKDIKEENKKRSQLKSIAILLSRILAISFLVIAFAKPYVPSEKMKINEDVFLYIDNSQSMNIDFGDGNLLNIAKNKAIEITEAYGAGFNYYLIENDFLGKHAMSYNSNAIKLQIEKINPSPKQRSMLDIILRKNSISSNNNHLYFISDFQENTLKIDELKHKNLKDNISFIPIENRNTVNISIDSIFIKEPVFLPNNEIILSVLISNSSNQNIKDEVLFLYLDEKQKSQQYINISAKESKEIIFKFISDNKTIINGEIRSYDSPITFDNNLFFTLKKKKKINVTSINNNNNNNLSFDALFGNDTSLFNFTSLERININQKNLLQQDLIILNEISSISSGLLNTLLSFTNNGGNLLIVPPPDIVNFNSYNLLLKSLKTDTIINKKELNIKINRFSTKHPIYKNVFTKSIDKINYPTSKKNYSLSKHKRSTQIIGLANREDFLGTYQAKKGAVYLFSSPLNKTCNNFTKHALFVPTLINIATSSILIEVPYYIIGSNKEINTQYTHKLNELITIKGENIEIIATITYRNGVQLLNYHNQILENGIYSILNKNQLIDKVAFNYNSSESKISLISKKKLKDLISINNLKNIKIISTGILELKRTIKEELFGREYWKAAMLLSLLFFAIEILLIKIIKS